MVGEQKILDPDAAAREGPVVASVAASEQTSSQKVRAVSAPADDFVGGVLDSKYQILQLLGRGGMSAVYLARHQLMKKMVAIKVLRTERADDAVAYRRLQQESQACAAMLHKNLVGVQDFGVTKDGTPYVVMDYVPGQSLGAWVENEHPDVDRLLDVFIQVCDGLSYAHRHGVIHRDLKPGNIMVYRDDEGRDVPKIVDFGIAKVINPSEEELHQLTQTGETFGSPMYMSPEQCLAVNLDARSDIYSLGCVIYEIFSGKPPFGGSSMYEIVHQHINVLPPPLIAPGIPEATRRKLELVIMKALAKVPAERQSSMQELKEDLEVARLSTREGFMAKLRGKVDLWRMRVVPVIAPYTSVVCIGLFVVSVLIVYGAMVFVHYLGDYESALDRVSHNKNICEIPIQTFTDVRSPLFQPLNRGDDDYTKGYFSAAGEEYVDALRHLPEEMQGSILECQIGARLGDSEIRCGDYDSGIFDLNTARKMAEQCVSETSDDELVHARETLAAITSELGFAYHRVVENEEIVLGRLTRSIGENFIQVSPEDAETSLKEIPKVWQGKNHRRLVLGIISIGKCSFERSEEYLADGAKLWRELGNNENAALCLGELGVLHFDYGRQRGRVVRKEEFAAAEKNYKEAIKILEENPDTRESREMARILDYYFILLWRDHRYIEALSVHSRAESVKSKYKTQNKLIDD